MFRQSRGLLLALSSRLFLLTLSSFQRDVTGRSSSFPAEPLFLGGGVSVEPSVTLDGRRGPTGLGFGSGRLMVCVSV